MRTFSLASGASLLPRRQAAARGVSHAVSAPRAPCLCLRALRCGAAGKAHAGPSVAGTPVPSTDKPVRKDYRKRTTDPRNAPDDRPAAADRPARDPAAWAEATKLGEGAVVTGTIEVANRGGVVVRFLKNLTGFLPLSQLDPARVPAHAPGAPMEGVLASLVGQQVSCAILELNAEKGAVVLSEKLAASAQDRATLAVGAVRTGSVKNLTEYGAFVELFGADGRPHGVEGLLHISELSWSRVRHPTDVLTLGQTVTVKVCSLDAATKRVGLSLRQLEQDPLLETLDTTLGRASAWPRLPAQPKDGVVEEDTFTLKRLSEEMPLPGLPEICEALRRTPGVEAVTLGRQALESRVVSQDLELWMTNDKVVDGYNLVARAGRQVQEVHVKSSLSREDIKVAVVRVTSRIK